MDPPATRNIESTVGTRRFREDVRSAWPDEHRFQAKNGAERRRNEQQGGGLKAFEEYATC